MQQITVLVSVSIIIPFRSRFVVDFGLESLSELIIQQTKQSVSSNQFDWTDEQQGIVLGSFFYGYITTQVLGGYLADRFGAKILFGGGVACTSILTILTEPIANLGFGWMVALRVLEGVGEGVTYPAISSFWGKWAPPNGKVLKKNE